MPSPTVSFVVPCYKLAHFLTECVNSILGQTYGDLEVLIMDDRSPDNTAEVACSFRDSRVKHIRNDSNLGALPNYNKGISMSSGKYVWLISADDYLRSSDVLQRYVELMEANPRINYTFCPGVEVKNGKEAGVLKYSTYGNEDRVIPGRVFLQKLLNCNLVLAPGAMARRDCYEKISYFPTNQVWNSVPIDLIWGGDWYLWCVFALEGDVGYFAEPMVCYREHELSSTTKITNENIANCFNAEIAVLWKVKREADAAGFRDISRKCLETLAFYYGRHLMTKQYRSSTSTITMEQFEESLAKNSSNEKEGNWVRARVFAGMADRFYYQQDLAAARKCYRAATRFEPSLVTAQVKKVLLFLGKPGTHLRQILRKFQW